MDRETKKLIQLVEDELYTEAKKLYIQSSMNHSYVKQLLFRTWLKTMLERDNTKETTKYMYNVMLKNNDEFKAVVKTKEV